MIPAVGVVTGVVGTNVRPDVASQPVLAVLGLVVAVAAVGAIGLAIIARYYGMAPQRSYFVGCSEGGREGMMLSQRFPEHFDGILSCSPGCSQGSITQSGPGKTRLSCPSRKRTK